MRRGSMVMLGVTLLGFFGAGGVVEARVLIGDFNDDGKVNFHDFFLFADAFGGSATVYDLEPNGAVNFTDFFIFADNFGAKAEPETRIVFESIRDGNFEIYAIEADGTEPVRLTNDPAVDLFPDWSPDGTKVVFESNRDDNFEVYAMDADGANPTNLTNHEDTDTGPGW